MAKSCDLIKAGLLILGTCLLNGCMMEASITSLAAVVGVPGPEMEQRTESDFTHAETVEATGTSGPLTIKGSIGEITTEVQTADGTIIQAKFY